MENRRACRIAIYTKAQISTDADNPTLLDWAAKRATYLYQAFGPHFMLGNALDWVERASKPSDDHEETGRLTGGS
jgi:hypothetical protein